MSRLRLLKLDWADCLRRIVKDLDMCGSLREFSCLSLQLVSPYSPKIYERLIFAAAAFLVDSPKEFNMRIDAPAEEEKDLFNNK